jgi:integrase/recombinase XerC
MKKDPFPKFIDYLTEEGRSTNTILNYRLDLQGFAEWFQQTNGETIKMQNITPTDIRQYKQFLQTVRKQKPASINRKLATLRVLSSWAQEKSMIETSFVRGTKDIKGQDLAPRWLDRKEELKLKRELERGVAAAQTKPAKLQAIRDASIFNLLLNTGLRISELCSLKMDDLSLSDRKGAILIRSGKGEKSRTIPLNQNAREAIRDWMKVRPQSTKDRLFSGKRGVGITPNAVQRRLTDYGRRVDIDVTPHVLRHTFAKKLTDSGISIEKVAELLGHASLNTTRRYIKPSQADLEKAVIQLEE